MLCLMNRIIFWYLVLENICVAAKQQLQIHTQPQYLTVSWQSQNITPSTWNVVYSMMGSSYHSSLTVAGTIHSVNITTAEYPGALYAIQLFAKNNGTNSFVARGFARADCSHSAEVDTGDTYQIESYGYPSNPVRGQICTWSFTGSNQTWYKIDFVDLDFGDGQSCDNNIRINDNIICDNGTFNGDLVVRKSSVDIKFVYIQDFGGKGFQINVTGIWKIEKPENLTGVLSNDDAILVTWLEPKNAPPEFDYVLRVSHFPHTSYADLVLPGNTTSHQVNTSSHAGQNFTFQVKIATNDVSGDFSDPVTVQTNCDRSIFIRQFQSITFASKGFPFHYLPGVHCQYNIKTTDNYYIKVMTTTFDIDGGSDCSSGYLTIGQMGKFCNDSPPSASYVISASSLFLDFFTGKIAKGEGFEMILKSVEKPPSAPFNLETRTEQGKIFLHWSPPSLRSEHLTGYTVEYSIVTVPSSTRNTLSMNRNSTDAVISTIHHHGRLFLLRVRATSEGGPSDYSIPHYARAACGSKFHLTRLTSAIILSPKDENNKYQPGVVCQWTVFTSSPLWLRVEIVKFDLEFSEGCRKDKVEFSAIDIGTKCGNNFTGESFVLKETGINVTFSSDYSNEYEGFILKITSVGPSPSKPNNIRVVPSEYALVASWNPPTTHRQYLTGYLVHYHLFGSTTVYTVRVLPEDMQYAIDTTNAPGQLYEVWVQTDGDAEKGATSDKVISYAACGESHKLQDDKIYITSPHYPHQYKSNIQCQWSIITNQNSSVTLRFLKLDLRNNNNSCNDNITISDLGVVCNDSVENINIVLRKLTRLLITFQTDGNDEGSGFLLAVEKTSPIPHLSVASRSRMISGSLKLEPSPATAFYSSATSLLLASVTSSSTIVSKSEIGSRIKWWSFSSFLPNLQSINVPTKTASSDIYSETRTQSIQTPAVVELVLTKNVSEKMSLSSSMFEHLVPKLRSVSYSDSILSVTLHSFNGLESKRISTVSGRNIVADFSTFSSSHDAGQPPVSFLTDLISTNNPHSEPFPQSTRESSILPSKTVNIEGDTTRTLRTSFTIVADGSTFSTPNDALPNLISTNSPHLEPFAQSTLETSLLPSRLVHFDGDTTQILRPSFPKLKLDDTVQYQTDRKQETKHLTDIIKTLFYLPLSAFSVSSVSQLHLTSTEEISNKPEHIVPGRTIVADVSTFSTSNDAGQPPISFLSNVLPNLMSTNSPHSKPFPQSTLEASILPSRPEHFDGDTTQTLRPSFTRVKLDDTVQYQTDIKQETKHISNIIETSFYLPSNAFSVSSITPLYLTNTEEISNKPVQIVSGRIIVADVSTFSISNDTGQPPVSILSNVLPNLISINSPNLESFPQSGLEASILPSRPEHLEEDTTQTLRPSFTKVKLDDTVQYQIEKIQETKQLTDIIQTSFYLPSNAFSISSITPLHLNTEESSNKTVHSSVQHGLNTTHSGLNILELELATSSINAQDTSVLILSTSVSVGLGVKNSSSMPYSPFDHTSTGPAVKNTTDKQNSWMLLGILALCSVRTAIHWL